MSETISQPPPPSPKQPERLRVLTLNIWNRQGPWDQRVGAIRRGIEKLSPDLIALQEVLHLDGAPPPWKPSQESQNESPLPLGEGKGEGATGDQAPRAPAPRNQAEEIADGLGYHAAFGAAWNIGGGLLFGNAVLSRFPIIEHQTFILPSGDDEARALLFATIAFPDFRVPLFVTHLNWKLHQSAIRQQQVAFIADRIAELCPTSADGADRFPPILAGDFNAEPLSDEIRFLHGFTALQGKSVYFADCFRVAKDGGDGATFCRRNPFAAVAREPDRRLDYVFVRGPDRRGRGEPLDCRVVLDEPDAESGVFASDHFGVFAELSTR